MSEYLFFISFIIIGFLLSYRSTLMLVAFERYSGPDFIKENGIDDAIYKFTVFCRTLFCMHIFLGLIGVFLTSSVLIGYASGMLLADILFRFRELNGYIVRFTILQATVNLVNIIKTTLETLNKNKEK